MNILTLFVAALGTVATLWCISLFVYFIRSRHQIGRAVGYDKCAEAIFSGVTLFFAYCAQGIWNTPLSDEFVAVIRTLAFVASLAASMHLTISVLNIIREKEQNGE